MDLPSLGREPILPDQPTGSDIRSTPEFEELQAEMDKLSQPSALQGVDWKRVEKLSSEILSRKSKDLLAASYLSVSLVHTRQAEGLAIGLEIYRDLLENFWENLYPAKARMRGRVRAIEWWLEKTETALQGEKLFPRTSDMIQQMKKNLGAIEKRLAEYLEGPPSLHAIHRMLDALSSLPEKKAEGEASPLSEKRQPVPTADHKPEQSPSSEAFPGTEDMASEQDAQRELQIALQKIQRVAAYLQEKEPMNPLSYRYVRVAAWSTVDSLPPAVNGMTRIPPPTAPVVDPLRDVREKKEWESLVRSAETSLSQFIFWLDLNCWTAEALVHLGTGHRDAHHVVCQETAFLIHRLPGLMDLCFSDGTPFANAETREWVKNIALHVDSSPGGPFLSAVAGNPADEGGIQKEVEEARALIQQGKLLEAVERLQQKMKNSSSRREKLLWRLALSQSLVSAKQSKLALPHLEEVLHDIDTYRLEDYDPPLALQGLKMAWLGFHSQADAGSKEKAAEILQRMARLDLTEVIRLGKA